MKNDYQIGGKKISIPPTVLFSTIGKIQDVRKAVTMDVKLPDDRIYVLGMTKDELGLPNISRLSDLSGTMFRK